MASIRFIIENDQPKELAVEGDLLEIVTCTTYLIGKVYRTLREQAPDAGTALREMLATVIADPESPVWTTEVASHPKKDDGGV